MSLASLGIFALDAVMDFNPCAVRRRLRAWERIAIVGDAGWLRRAVNGLGWLMPGELKVFGVDELDSAREWVTSFLPDPEPFY